MVLILQMRFLSLFFLVFSPKRNAHECVRCEQLSSEGGEDGKRKVFPLPSTEGKKYKVQTRILFFGFFIEDTRVFLFFNVENGLLLLLLLLFCRKRVRDKGGRGEAAGRC